MAETMTTTQDWVPEDTFAARLAQLRIAKRWNIAEAAEACDLNAESWRNWEKHGRSPRDKVDVAEKIHAATGVSLGWLLAGVQNWKFLLPVENVPDEQMEMAFTGRAALTPV